DAIESLLHQCEAALARLRQIDPQQPWDNLGSGACVPVGRCLDELALAALAIDADVPPPVKPVPLFSLPTAHHLPAAVRYVMELRSWARNLQPGGGAAPVVHQLADRLAGLSDAAWMNHVELAEAMGLEAEPLRCRLDRWRKGNPGSDGWREVTERRARQPKYMYRIGTIRPVLMNALPG